MRRTLSERVIVAHVVAAIAVSETAPSLVFKGGTALRLCHFEEFRYSADLDFSIVDGTSEDGLRTVREALQVVAGAISQLRLTDDDTPRVAYMGPLGRRRTLKLDIADDEYVVHTENRPLLPRWPDLPRAACRVEGPLRRPGFTPVGRDYR